MIKPIFTLLLVGNLFLSSCGGGPFNINEAGGTVFTIEPSASDFIVQSSGHSMNPQFAKALAQAQQSERSDERGFIVAFVEAIYTMPSANPASIFFTANREKYRISMGKDELLKTLMDEYDLATSRTQHIIDSRLSSLGISESERNVYKNKEGRIVVEVGNGFKPDRLRKLIQSTAEFGFYETYENNEVYTYIDKLNQELSAEMYPGIDTLSEDNPEYQQMKTPLFRYLTIDMYKRQDSRGYELSKGCRIGFAQLKDTANINHLLKTETARLIFPQNMFFIWSLKPEEMSNENNTIMGLYAIKARNIFEPALPGDVITDARVQEDDQSGGARVQVQITMNNEGAEDWKRITENNMNRAIAMVIDEQVLSAPIVVGVIQNGSSVVSGNFTREEAEDMANILKAGRLPVRTRIIEEKQVGPKK